MKELNESELNRRYVPLVRLYAELLKQGLPDEEVAGWQARVDKLPPIARDIVLEVTRIDDDLKDAIQDVRAVETWAAHHAQGGREGHRRKTRLVTVSISARSARP